MKLGRIRRAARQAGRAQLHKRMGAQTVWQVLQQWTGRKISSRVACRWLGVGRSRLYALKKRWGAIPAESVPQAALYVRSPSLALPSSVQEFLREELHHMKNKSRVMDGHLNFALLAQQCHQRFRRRFHRNTLRRWAIRQGLYRPDKDPTSKPFTRFEMGGIGLLFQHDSSIHLWVPAFGKPCILIATIDDHSRKIVGARLVPRDTSWHHLEVVRKTVETYGRPAAYYTDNHMIFKPHTDTHVQFGRALKALDIDLRLTGKAQPQAKGKIEKWFDYIQRRVPYLCEQRHVTNLTDANRVLNEQVDYYNRCHVHDDTKEIPGRRWDRALTEGRTYLRPWPDNLSWDLTFALHYSRVVAKDGSVKFAGHRWPVPSAPRWGRATVVLRPPTSARRPHTEITVLYPGGSAHFVLPRSAAARHPDFRQEL